MRYIIQSELGEKRFYKIERLRDFLWIYFPKWLHKLSVYRIRKNGIWERGKFINDKKIIRF